MRNTSDLLTGERNNVGMVTGINVKAESLEDNIFSEVSRTVRRRF